MPDFSVPVEPCGERPLFGGAISSTFPQRFQVCNVQRIITVKADGSSDDLRPRNREIELENEKRIFCRIAERLSNDLSHIREVPDHQEVFADPNRDESLIVELLDLKHDVADNQSALWFLQDLANEQDSAENLVVESVRTVAPSDAPFLDPATVVTAVVGQMAVSKGRQGREARNTVRVYLANIRLKGVGTDLLITAYEPLMISALSESAATVGPGAPVPAVATGCMPVVEAFKLCLATFKIHNWRLFGP